MRALIAEDDFVSRILMQKLLREFGSAQVVETGEAAVYAVKEAIRNLRPFNLICLDVMMPVMDGREALKQIRELELDVQNRLKPSIIVMTTALSDKDTVRTTIQAGCDGYVVKPLDREKFLEQLRSFGLI